MIIDDAPAKTDSKPADTSGTAGAKSDAPASYSRGEGQKGVTQAYRDNWHVIFGDKKRPARKSGTKAKPAAMRRRTSASRNKKSGRR